jgi:putative redox protein
MALGACTSMTLRMYANHKGLPLDDVTVRLRHDRVHADDCVDCTEQSRKLERIGRVLTLTGDLTEAQRERLLHVANRCPVHRTLEGELSIETALDQERRRQ